ncbi:MAG TPA: cellulase N-terminal Ig-like domain-containing protein, partial [Sedimentisphaerales bacterium]|nr:cellulase N-terminal Ig-like domain-containing protein [Sedimentisphaerales bacterium]
MTKQASLTRSFSLFAIILCVEAPLLGQPFSRDVQVDVRVNQVGFGPGAAKFCVLQEGPADRFEVIRTDDLKVVFSGPLVRSQGDFGSFARGDFSEVADPNGTAVHKACDTRGLCFLQLLTELLSGSLHEGVAVATAFEDPWLDAA